MLIERERLRGRFQTALVNLARWSYESGDSDAATKAAMKLLQSDPFSEEMHRLLMRSYVQAGMRSRALEQYRFCERLLRREFDAEPEHATRALFEQVRRAGLAEAVESDGVLIRF